MRVRFDAPQTIVLLQLRKELLAARTVKNNRVHSPSPISSSRKRRTLADEQLHRECGDLRQPSAQRVTREGQPITGGFGRLEDSVGECNCRVGVSVVLVVDDRFPVGFQGSRFSEAGSGVRNDNLDQETDVRGVSSEFVKGYDLTWPWDSQKKAAPW